MSRFRLQLQDETPPTYRFPTDDEPVSTDRLVRGMEASLDAIDAKLEELSELLEPISFADYAGSDDDRPWAA